jgi:hypothetical protein
MTVNPPMGSFTRSPAGRWSSDRRRTTEPPPPGSTGRTKFEGHRSSRPKCHRGNVSASQVFDLDHAVRILAFDEPRGLHRVVLSVAVTARRAGADLRPPNA